MGVRTLGSVSLEILEALKEKLGTTWEVHSHQFPWPLELAKGQ